MAKKKKRKPNLKKWAKEKVPNTSGEKYNRKETQRKALLVASKSFGEGK